MFLVSSSNGWVVIGQNGEPAQKQQRRKVAKQSSLNEQAFCGRSTPRSPRGSVTDKFIENVMRSNARFALRHYRKTFAWLQRISLIASRGGRWSFLGGVLAGLNFNLPMTQLAPNARQMPAILVVANEADQMQPDTSEASQINAGSGDVWQREDLVMVCHTRRMQ
jgi:hypothetical protein